MNRLLTILFMVGISGPLFGQDTATEDFDILICKEWILKYYELDGEKFPPSQDQMNDRLIFYLDHKAKSIEASRIQNGVWEYTPNEKLLSAIDNDTKEKANLTVISLTETACVLEVTNPGGWKMKMYMVPSEE